MKVTSKAQRRLMGWAYACKTGKSTDCPPNVQKLADEMSLYDLKKAAETSEDDLPEESTDESATVSNVNGMGPVFLPNGSSSGSGDFPHSIPDSLKDKLSKIRPNSAGSYVVKVKMKNGKNIKAKIFDSEVSDVDLNNEEVEDVFLYDVASLMTLDEYRDLESVKYQTFESFSK